MPCLDVVYFVYDAAFLINRSCGGIYCENCCVPAAGTEKGRLCGGCRRGETPGAAIKKVSEMYFKTYRPGDVHVTPGVNFNLVRGSLFLDEDATDRGIPSGKAMPRAPASGYFEIINKSEEICCVKLLLSGADSMYELPRPTYYALPPLESLNCFFNAEMDCIVLMVLTDNPYAIPSGRRVVYDTSCGPGGAPVTNISLCAAVAEFRHCVIYRIASRGCNVLLKYKDGGVVEPRQGNSVARVGIFSKVIGSKKAVDDYHLDFGTNIQSLDVEYNSKA